MQELKKRLQTLETDFLEVYQKLNIKDKLKTINALEKEVADPDIWKDVAVATDKNQTLKKLQDETAPFELLKTLPK